MGLVIPESTQQPTEAESSGLPITSLNDLSVNCLITGNGMTFTVVQIYPNQGQLAVSLHKKRPTKPVIINFSEGIEGLDWVNFKRTPNQFSLQDWFLRANEKSWEIAAERYEAVKPIIGSRDQGIESQVEAYIRGYLSTEFIKQVAASAPIQKSKQNSKSARVRAESKKSGVSIQSIYAWLNRLLAYGGGKASLLPNYNVCGKSRSLPEDPEQALKRQQERGGSYIGRRIREELQQQVYRRDTNQQDTSRLDTFLAHSLKDCEDYKVTSVHAHYTAEYCYDESDCLGLDEPISYLNLSKYMTYHQFRHHYKKRVDHNYLAQLKTSLKQAHNDRSRKLGTAQQNSIGPSDLYEIDSTTLNIYVVSRVLLKNSKIKTKPLGRPYLYFVVDVYSGMIVGYCITFRRNAMAAKRALYNAFTNKVEHCAKFGIPISQEEWPCHHICLRLVCDRGGEYYKGLFSDALEADLGWEGISFTPAYLSRGKGTVEVNFHAVDGFLIQRLPGKVKPNPAKDAVHPSNFARMNLTELNQLIIKAILIFNRSRMNFNRLNSFDVECDTAATPLNIWNEHIGQKMGGGVIKPREQVQYAMLHRGDAKVARDEVTLRTESYSLTYRTDDRAFQQLQEKLRDEKANFQLSVRYNPDDPRYIWSAVPDLEGRIIRFELTSEDRRFDNLHEKEIENRVLYETAIRAVARQHKELEQVDMYGEVLKVLKTSKAAKSRKPTRKGMAKGLDENFSDAAITETVRESNLIKSLFETAALPQATGGADVQ